MRVTGGSARGRRLEVPAVRGLRPTTDRARETLFNVLGQRLDGVRVLDLFAGSGALGIEALSRGAARCVFVERDGGAVRGLLRNLEVTGTVESGEVMRSDWRTAVRRLAVAGELFDLVVLDPPYGRGLIGPVLAAITEAGLLDRDGWMAAEHASGDAVPAPPPGYERFRELSVGSSRISLYRAAQS
jgi:16S rRNA (guanine(966)-N(2))-methyltransferase RsmD